MDIDHDVEGLDVPMHNLVVVKKGDRHGHLGRHLEAHNGGQRTLLLTMEHIEPEADEEEEGEWAAHRLPLCMNSMMIVRVEETAEIS